MKVLDWIRKAIRVGSRYAMVAFALLIMFPLLSIVTAFAGLFTALGFISASLLDGLIEFSNELRELVEQTY